MGSDLWGNWNFRRLWLGQTISQFGSGITREALPLAAALLLHVTPGQMGLLAALSAAPAMLLGLPAGAWVDRWRRPVLIAADLGRAALLLILPAAFFLGHLTLPLLYTVVLLIGALSVFFDVAYVAFLPTIVRQRQLVEANSKLGISDSLAEIGGPSLAGILVQTISAPYTLLLDALSYLASAFFVGRIQVEEPSHPAPPGSNLRSEVLAGLRMAAGDPLLRAFAGALGMLSFFGGFYGALYSLFLLRDLDIPPAILGPLIGAGGIGALFGALLAGASARRWGIGGAAQWAFLAMGVISVLTPLASGPRWLVVVMLLAAQLFGDAARTIFFIHQVSLRQTVTPAAMLGRVNASMDVLTAVFGVAGLLAGGLLGEALGMRTALFVAVAGKVLAGLWLYFSPLRQVKK